VTGAASPLTVTGLTTARYTFAVGLNPAVPALPQALLAVVRGPPPPHPRRGQGGNRQPASPSPPANDNVLSVTGLTVTATTTTNSARGQTATGGSQPAQRHGFVT